MEDRPQATSQARSLELEVDMAQQQLEWRLQRIAWVVFYGLLAAIVLGLLGQGPLSEARVGSARDPLHMDYQRFLRHRTPDTLHVTLMPSGDTASLLIEREYVKRAGLQTVTPQPLRTLSEDGALVFIFAARAGMPVEVELDIRAERVGTLAGWIAVPGRDKLRFSQFVYP